MARFLCFVLIFISVFSSAQQTVSGKVHNEDGIPLSNVLVFNVRTEERKWTNTFGEFSISAQQEDELRFIRKGYERINRRVKISDFSDVMQTILKISYQDIEEVEVKRKPTGNIGKDSQYYNESKELAKAKVELGNYIRQKSSEEVTAKKGGDFVQPKGEGFGAKYGYKWETLDLLEYLISYIGQKNIVNDYGITEPEIIPFFRKVLLKFEHKNILRFGHCTSADVMRFIGLANQEIEIWKNKTIPIK